MKTNDLVSIIVPCYNEETNIRPFYTAVKSVFDSMQQVSGEEYAITGGVLQNLRFCS